MKNSINTPLKISSVNVTKPQFPWFHWGFLNHNLLLANISITRKKHFKEYFLRVYRNKKQCQSIVFKIVYKTLPLYYFMRDKWKYKTLFLYYLVRDKWEININPIQYGPFWGCSWMEGRGKKDPPKNLSHISFNDQTWQSYISPKEDPKNI